MRNAKITRLQAENVKRLVVVDIDLSGPNVTIVGGKNGAGKSTVLDSIAYAIGGKDLCPKDPIRHGEKSAEITVTIKDAGGEQLLVTRRFTEAGSYLSVTHADGSTLKSPQALLDQLYGTLTFDPLAFSTMKPADQVATLMRLAKLDFVEIDATRREAFEKRTIVNRDLKRLESSLPAAVTGAPSAPVDVPALLAERNGVAAVRDANDAKRRELAQAKRDRSTTVDAIDRLNAQHRDLLRKLDEVIALRDQAIKAYEIVDKAVADIDVIVAALTDPDTSAIDSKIAIAHTANAAFDRAQARAVAEHGLAKVRAEAEELSAQLEEIDAFKASSIANAAMPIPGLAFRDDSVTLAGIPFDQLSSAERLRVSVAMAIAMNPALRVMLIRDGSLLDDDSLHMVAEMAEQADAQVLIERVGDGAECSVVIEAGEVRGAAIGGAR